ncbi:hypothetical protein KC867_03400 [Candidatus Saccharibacteria bacterium]|nr:hypothetical protein [Candidatus Saccharibacteria bacterium]
MTPKTKTEVQQAALALNSLDQPFVIKAAGDQIIGQWNILDAKWLGILSANSAQKDYTITIDLDEPNHKYKYVESSQSSESSAGIGGLSTEKSFFKGKQFGTHQAGIEIGFGMKNKDEPTKVVGAATYNFNNSQIKKPLLDLLQQAGWSENKTSFLKKLFGSN